MSFREPYDAELHLDTLIHRGQWPQALAAIDEGLTQEPWRAELLLRKAQVLRALQLFEQGLVVIRAYRAQRAAADEVVYQEVEFLLDLGRTAEALELVEHVSREQQKTSLHIYYRGRVLLARNEVAAGLQELWRSHECEPGFHRALIDWTKMAVRYQGRWRVRRQLQQLLARRGHDPATAISVGLALSMLDDRHGRSILRHAVDRYPEYVSASRQRASSHREQKRAEETYRAVSEQILAGRYQQAIAMFDTAVREEPVWMPVLAPLVAEILTDVLVRPEEARRLLEEAMRREPENYRLHSAYTKVFMRLGFVEEALSSANCALALSPDAEKAIARIQRAAALVQARQFDRAIVDLMSAVNRLPEARGLIRAELALRPLARDARFRALLGTDGTTTQPSMWSKILRWLIGP